MNHNSTAPSLQQPANIRAVSSVRSKLVSQVVQLTFIEKIMMVSSLLAIIGFILCNLWIQYHNQQLQVQIETYETAIADLKADEDYLLTEIMETFNFELLREIAHEEGMTIDNSRIKEVKHP